MDNMTPEQLQEIKDRYVLPYGEDHLSHEAHVIGEDVYELITALENQGELLQLSLANVDRLNDELVEANELYDIAEEGRVLFMNQLGELTPEYASERMVDLLRDIADLRKQLAVLLEREKRMQAEHSISMDNYEKQLAEAQNDATYHATLANSATGKLSDAQVELSNLREQLAEREKDSDNCEERVDELTNDLADAQADRDNAIVREAGQFAKDRDKLEQAQAELAEAKRHTNKVGEAWRQKYSEETARLDGEVERITLAHNRTEKQLAEAQAEVKRLEALPHDEIILLEDKEDVE